MESQRSGQSTSRTGGAAFYPDRTLGYDRPMDLSNYPSLIFVGVTCPLSVLVIGWYVFRSLRASRTLYKEQKLHERFLLEAVRLAAFKLKLSRAPPEKMNMKGLPPLPPGAEWVTYEDCPWWKGRFRDVPVTLIFHDTKVRVRLGFDKPLSFKLWVPSPTDCDMNDPWSNGISVGPVEADECWWTDDAVGVPVVTLKTAEERVRQLFQPPLGDELRRVVMSQDARIGSEGLSYEHQLWGHTAVKERNREKLAELIYDGVSTAVDVFAKVRRRAAELKLA
jgi:hypothetical protein